jgi:uroporphyrinogen-III synthase
MHLIATRPQADSEKLKARLEAASHKVSVAPLLAIVVEASATVPDEPWQAILVTSANALSSLSELGITPQLKQIPLMAVGSASARLAGELGFAHVKQADGGDLAGLTETCLTTLDPEAGPLLYLSGKVRSGDLVGNLTAGGFKTIRLELYDAVPAKQLPDNILTSLRAGKIDGVVLYSPRTATVWVDLINKTDLKSQTEKIVHFCLSENVAHRLRDTAGTKIEIAVASNPNDDAMLECIEKVSANYGSKSTVPGESVEMANRKRPTSKAVKKARPTVIDATATEVSASKSEDAATPDTGQPCKPEPVSAEKPEGPDRPSTKTDTKPNVEDSPDVEAAAQVEAAAKLGSGKGKLITGALLATLLAGVAGGGYLYREHGQKLFGTQTPAIDVGAIEGQAMEAVGAAQSASETASSALVETKALADKFAQLEQKLEATSNTTARPDEQTLASITTAVETAKSAKAESETLSAKTGEIGAGLDEVKQSVTSLKQALESAAESGGSVDQADLNLKIDGLAQRIGKLESIQTEQANSSMSAVDLKPVEEQLAAANARIEALETRLADLATAPVAQAEEQAPAIDVAKVTTQLNAASSAARSGKPFEAELAALEATIGSPLNVPALASNAASGVQTLEQLKTSLDELSVDQASAAASPSGNSGMWDSVVGKLSSVIKVRKLSENDWSDRLAQARAAFDTTGLQAAIRALDAGSNGAATTPESVKAWLVEARKHIETDKALQQLPQTILGRLPTSAQ